MPTIHHPREWVWVLTFYILFFIFLAVTAHPDSTFGRKRQAFFAYLEALAQILEPTLRQGGLAAVAICVVAVAYRG